jgi:hypothetical protein
MLRKGGYTGKEIAEACGVNQSQISRLKKRMQGEVKAVIPVPEEVPANEREAYRKGALEALTVEDRIKMLASLAGSDNEGIRMRALEKLDEISELVNAQEAPALVPIFSLPRDTKLPFGPPPDQDKK